MSENSELPTPQSSRPLGHFDVLVGPWTMVGTHPAFPAAANGRSSFEWLVDGALLVWHFDWEQPGPPSATSVIGWDDATETGLMLYSDERGVTRVYQVSVKDAIWRMWREAPAFSQGMAGRFSDDGNTIRVHGELSRDGSTWEPDLDVTYSRGGVG